MPAPKGTRPPNAGKGRKKGVPNKATAARERLIAAGGLTPLDYLMSVVRDPEAPRDVRIEAARAAAPYVHPRLAQVEHVGKGGGPIQHRYSGYERARRVAFALDPPKDGKTPPLHKQH